MADHAQNRAAPLLAWGGIGLVILAGLAGLAAALILRERVAAAPSGGSGRAPELAGNHWLNTPGAKPVRLAARHGRVTIVHFWTYGCINCRHNLPSYARWQKRFAGKDVELVGVHTPETEAEGQPANVSRSVKELGITHPVLLDPTGENWRRWGVRYWPTVFLIDKQGRIRERWEGELEYQGAGGEKKLGDRVEQLLGE